MQPKTTFAFCLAAAGFETAAALKRIVSAAGQTAAIPSWDLQSSAKAGSDLAALSKPGVDTSSGVYNDTQLFFSDNLSKVDADQFLVPWLYRNEFALDSAAPGKHYFLKTHGITSRADIFLNGKQVADKSVQAGAYGGHTYDITSLADKKNVLVIRAYPTSYYYDFAIGWVDWNYWPNDNGTSVWRDVEVKQTGSVALGPLLQEHTIFIVNGQPFQVIGGGYAPDIFLRSDSARLEAELKYVLDLGFNTIRLEGKNEHPELYDLADRMGVMIMPGWECCDKWEAWSYNNDLAVATLLMYFIGSDYYPDDRAAPIYLDAFRAGDWQVPPNYWYDTEPYGKRLGAAYGFNTELSASVGTPDLSSLKKFLSAADLDDLWKNPNKNLFHISTATSSFHNRAIYNTALWKRWGAPTSLEDYPALEHLGLLHVPGGGYFGAKTGSRAEHVTFDYVRQAVYLVNRSLGKAGPRTVDIQVIDTAGKTIASLKSALSGIKDVVFVRLVLSDSASGAVLSRNFVTPVTTYSDYTALNKLAAASVAATATQTKDGGGGGGGAVAVTLENLSSVPAFFSDSYVTLWPREKLTLMATPLGGAAAGAAVLLAGKNVAKQTVAVA
ncbi:glycoside hydrolase superfamily [Lasiosphaeria miniovina]|uniref:Glycoside hydrolase superfamily n=1 Tax=Lasiosphaeria miniovina TaxID=1954250 RepID=A0AA40AMV0_9PEZI|nr:glycoside hydrolase superfamily [Lasiosphaeria miniovina]KAK0718617.1 glycoside hydrolase superfamily [Lasiosphaeria miniovina]